MPGVVNNQPNPPNQQGPPNSFWFYELLRLQHLLIAIKRDMVIANSRIGTIDPEHYREIIDVIINNMTMVVGDFTIFVRAHTQ